MEGLKCPYCSMEHDPAEEYCPFYGSPLPRHPQASAKRLGTEQSSVVAPVSPSGEGDPFAPGPVEITIGTAGREIRLHPGDRLIVGRSPDSPLAGLCTSNISWRHIAIYVNEDGAFIEDTDSTNGTFVDGERLKPRRPRALTASVEVQLGAGDNLDPPLCMTIRVEGGA